MVRESTCTMNESHKYPEKKKKWKMTQDTVFLTYFSFVHLFSFILSFSFLITHVQLNKSYMIFTSLHNSLVHSISSFGPTNFNNTITHHPIPPFHPPPPTQHFRMSTFKTGEFKAYKCRNWHLCTLTHFGFIYSLNLYLAFLVICTYSFEVSTLDY